MNRRPRAPQGSDPRRPGGRPPRRRPSRAVIIRRRVTVLLALLGVVALLAWGVVAIAGAVQAAAEATVAGAATVAQGAAPNQSGEPTRPADPTTCEPGALDVALTASADAAGPVAFDVALTNEGDVPCLLDVGAEHLVLTVHSGEDRVWSSGDCPAGDVSRRLLLDVDDTADAAIGWQGQRSGPGCEAPGSAGAGTYRVEAALDGARLPDAREVFTLG